MTAHSIAAIFAAAAWTTQPRSEHPSGTPERTSDPPLAFDFAKQHGASILTDVDMSAAGVSEAAFKVFGSSLVAVQAPVHVGTNNFGFKAGTPITNDEARPAHVDTIIQYSVVPYEAPDYFMLCARRPSPGGESFLASLPAAIRRMPKESQAYVNGSLEFIQRVNLPPGYDRLSENNTDFTQPASEEEAAPPPPIDRVERFVFANPRGRPAHRVSSCSDAESMLAAFQTETTPPVRPLESAADPELDKKVVMEYLHAVAAESAEAARFRLEEGEGAIVDNYLVAHGREAYSDLDRALWQIWAWTNESLAVPESPGPNREWMLHPSKKRKEEL